MKKILVTSLLALTIANCFSQQPDTAFADKLIKLKYSKRILAKYVNFDVLKLMFGRGKADYHAANYGMGFSFRVQGLWPYSPNKNCFLPIAYGLMFGYNKVSIKKTKLGFTDHELTSLNKSTELKNTMQRTGYVGPVVMGIIRMNSFTLYGGASAEYNLFSKIKERPAKGNNSYSSRKFIRRVAVPLHVQLSYSPTQFYSFGLFGSYYTKPLFKGDKFNTFKQSAMGLSAALII